MNPEERARTLQGVGFAMAAFIFWGFSPIYFKILADVPVGEILTHRILWSVVCLAPFLVVTRRINGARILWERPKVLGLVLLASSLVGINWLVFLWAVVHERVLARGVDGPRGGHSERGQPHAGDDVPLVGARHGTPFGATDESR